MLLQVISENLEREKVFSEAKAKSIQTGKPLLNAGCGSIKLIGGFTRAILESDVNLDIDPREVPDFVQASIEDIPFPDKYFGVVFCCHVLEHVESLEAAKGELERVADYQFIITPSPIFPLSVLHPGHKRVFKDIKGEKVLLELPPKLRGF